MATSQLTSVSLPGDLLEDAPEDAALTLNADDITVTVNGDSSGQKNLAAKGQEHHASITFRVDEWDFEACDAIETIGPFELTIIGGVVTLEQDSFPLNARARSLVRSGRFEFCAETEADFDGSIVLGGVSFEFGRLHSNEERVVLCHIPPGEEDDAHTITVGSSAVDAHLAHGDYLGDCEDRDDSDADDDEGDSDDGADDDTGVAGDWDGDGLDDPARYRASTGDWHFTTRVGKGILVGASVIGFGANAAPVTGSWATIRAAD